MRNRCFFIVTLMCLMSSAYVCGQERLTPESMDGSSTKEHDRYVRKVDNLLNRKGVYACVVRPSFENEYSLLVYDDKLKVLTSNTQIWYEKHKPRSSKSASLKVDGEICKALQGLFEVAIGTRSKYADDRWSVTLDGVTWVFSNPSGKRASSHSPAAGTATGKLVSLVEKVIKGVRNDDAASVSELQDNIRTLADSFRSLQPGPDLEYDNSIFSASNNDGVNISYVITSASELTCKVTFPPGTGYLNQEVYSAGSIVIPSTVEHNGRTYTVTRIGERAFEQCTELKSVVIPNTVIWIEDNAFYGCYELSHIDIPETVTGIGNMAFYSCSSLPSLTVHRNVSHIGAGAFGTCSGLASITVDSSNMYYDSRSDCNGIIETASGCMIAGCMNTRIPETVKSIGDDAFSGCESLKSIVIPNSVTGIGGSAFANSGLSGIVIPESVTEMGDRAFLNCHSLKEVRLPESIRKIGTFAFAYCANLESVNIPESVRYIGVSAFSNCYSLKEVNISADTIGNVAFNECKCLTDVRLTDSVRYIGRAAFAACKSLKVLTIPAKVTRLEPYIFGFGSDSDITVTMESSVPPEFDRETFPAGMTIYIPKGSKMAYQQAYPEDYNFVEVQ